MTPDARVIRKASLGLEKNTKRYRKFSWLCTISRVVSFVKCDEHVVVVGRARRLRIVPSLRLCRIPHSIFAGTATRKRLPRKYGFQ